VTPARSWKSGVGREEARATVHRLGRDQGVGCRESDASAGGLCHEIGGHDAVSFGGQGDGKALTDPGQELLVLRAVGDATEHLLEDDPGESFLLPGEEGAHLASDRPLRFAPATAAQDGGDHRG
jgi:hypothetical protein